MSSTPGHIRGSGPHRSTSIGTARSDEALIGRKAGISTNVNNDYLTGFAHYQGSWARIRQTIREPAAEMLGTMMLTLVGNATNCQVVLSANSGVASSQKGDYLSLSFGWACSVSLGAWIAGGVSGGHVNPVVTLCLAIFRGFPWKKVPGYVIGQLIGAWLGALLVFGNYLNAIAIVEGGKGKLSLKTGELFGSYALDYMSAPNCFFDEFLGTFVLLLVVFAITDKNNGPPPPGLVPLVVFIAILGIAVGFGMQTGFAINPARDLGPRIVTAMVGYGSQVFTFRNQYWLWSPFLGSVCGGLVASGLYDSLIYLGAEGPQAIDTHNGSARPDTGRHEGPSEFSLELGRMQSHGI